MDYNVVYSKRNPTVFTESTIQLPSWLSATEQKIAELPRYSKYWSDAEAIMHYQASFYGAEHWYHEIEHYTPRSVLIELTDDDIVGLLDTENRRFSPRVHTIITEALQSGLHFIKSSKKSSHMQRSVYTVEECLQEITDYADVIMSFKYGCRYLFLREYVDIDSEYRVVVYRGVVTYIELYAGETRPDTNMLLQFMETVLSGLHYKDATVDVALLRDGTLTVIEVNTPPYLFAGLNHKTVLYGSSESVYGEG